MKPDPGGLGGPRRRRPVLLFLVVISLILAAALAVFFLVMRPPLSDLGHLAAFLLATAAISGAAGYLAYRLGWLDRSPTIRLAILGGYALASLLTILNVWLAARQMFASQHDLILGTILLLFAGGIAMALGYLFASALTERIRTVQQAAQVLAAGELGTRVPVQGRDEVASLASSFNRMAAELQAAAAQREQLETLKYELITWIGHDLQTPLASVAAIVEALADGIFEDEATIQRYLATAKKDLRALSMLIDDLFQMAQLEAGGIVLNRELVSLSDMFSDTLESFSSAARNAGVYLEGTVTAEIGLINVDPARIGRVINNLVDNGIRYTPAGGTVSLHAYQSADGVTIQVCNPGEGIPAADLPLVFDRFFRSEKSRSRSSGGSGLGLAIAKGIVEAHGGTISVESEPGRTCFSCVLPAANAQPRLGGPVEGSPTPAPPG